MCKPNVSNSNASADLSQQTGAQAEAWFENYVAQTQGQRDAASAQDLQIGQAQLGSMSFAQDQAQQLADRNKTVYQPLEDQIIDQAKNYDTPDRREAAATSARADVESNIHAQEDAQNRSLARSGIAPGSMRSQAANNDMALAGALGETSASTAARNQVEMTGHAMEMDAAGLGKGVIGNQGTMLQAAQNGGAQAVSATGAGLAAAYSAAPLMQTGYGQMLQGYQIGGNLFAQGESIRASGGGLGSMMQGAGGLMQGIGAMSSKKLKTDKTPVSDEEALAAVEKTPVQGWKYKPGVADEGAHVGPYAEDVQKNMGDKVAPGGKMVSLTLMQDMNAKALKALSKELSGVTAQIAKLEGGKKAASKARA